MPIAALIISGVAILIAIASAVYTKVTADETRKARLDVLGPTVMTKIEEVARDRWNVLAVGDNFRHPPGHVDPGKAFNWPGDSDTRLLTGARVLISNEGDTTCQIHIDAFRVDFAEPNDWETKIDINTGVTFDHRIPDGKFSIAPKDNRIVMIRNGPTLAEWRAAGGDRPVVSTITASVTPEGAHQVWELVLETQLLTTVPHNDATYELRAHVLPAAQLKPLGRTYP